MQNRNLWYIILIIISMTISIFFHFRSPLLMGDEPRYIWYANQLLIGHYSTPYPNVYIWNGPILPIILMPMVKLGFSVFWKRICCSLFFIFGIILLSEVYRRKFNNAKYKLVGLILIFYIPAYRATSFILAEGLVFFLISYLVFIINLQKQNHWKTGILLALIALTKIIFGYIILVGLIFSIIFKFLKRSKNTEYFFKSFLIGYLVCLPYLIYTYSLTGKINYWGNSGGASLYWMSSPFENEYGDWPAFHTNNLQYTFKEINLNHNKQLDSIFKLPKYLQDDAYKSIAIKNIKNHPIKYLRNIISNIQRFLTDMPRSYAKQSEFGLWILFFNLPLLFIVILFFLQKNEFLMLTQDYKFIIIFGLMITYFLLSILVYTESRYFLPEIPLIFGLFALTSKNNKPNFE